MNGYCSRLVGFTSKVSQSLAIYITVSTYTCRVIKCCSLPHCCFVKKQHFGLRSIHGIEYLKHSHLNCVVGSLNNDQYGVSTRRSLPILIYRKHCSPKTKIHDSTIIKTSILVSHSLQFFSDPQGIKELNLVVA